MSNQVKYVPSWVPFTAFKTAAAKWRTSVDIAEAVPFDLAKKAIVSLYEMWYSDLIDNCVFL